MAEYHLLFTLNKYETMDKRTNTVKRAVVNGYIVEDFDCAICHEVFDNPRLLKCGHSFCIGCLLDCIDRIRNERDSGNNLICPLCRQRTVIPTHIINKVRICEDDVENAMPKNIALANAIGTLNVEQEFCTKHPNKILEYFCEIHQALSCSKCIMLLHRQCKNVIDIDDCDEKALKQLLSDAKSRLTDTYSTRSQRIKSMVEIKQVAINKLDKLKEDIDGIISNGNADIVKHTNILIEDVHRQYGQPPSLNQNNISPNKRSFVLLMQKITTRHAQLITCNRKSQDANETYEDILNTVKASIKRELDPILQRETCGTATKTARHSPEAGPSNNT